MLRPGASRRSECLQRPAALLVCLGLVACSGELRPLSCPGDQLPSLFCPHEGAEPTPDGGVDGGTFVSMPWGTYAASLDVPACPPGAPLLVNTTEEGVDGDFTDPAQTGPTLSFLQALRIATNRSGPDTITFDADVFPLRNPGVIRLSGDAKLTYLQQTCIDGRDRGVIIEWATSNSCTDCIWGLTNDSLQVGLTLRSAPGPLSVRGGSQVAGCFLDGEFPSADVANGTVGPGNVLTGTLGCIVRFDDSTVKGNFFGYDPTTQTRMKPGLQAGLQLFGNAEVAENTFSSAVGLQFVAPFLPATTTIRKNIFENDVGTISSGIVVFGPDNVVRAGVGLTISERARVRITRNSITGARQWLPYPLGAPVDPPTITSVSTDLVTGTCPVAGLVELFADPKDQGEQFLAESPCVQGAKWEIVVKVPPTGFVTATLTDSQHRTSAFSLPRATR